MPKRLPFEENTYYHVYNRWYKHQSIFFCDKDFERFLRYIDLNLQKHKEEIGLLAYCLLPNHFHFVLQSKKEWFAISQFVGTVTMSYLKYLGAKYGVEKQGSWFFESRFKAKKIDSQQYLEDCINYVEFNALKHQLVDKPDQRAFSSRNREKEYKTEMIAVDWEF